MTSQTNYTCNRCGKQKRGVADASREFDLPANSQQASMARLFGYTLIAGTPVVAGLHMALLPPVAIAVFRSSRHLVVAPNSALLRLEAF